MGPPWAAILGVLGCCVTDSAHPRGGLKSSGHFLTHWHFWIPAGFSGTGVPKPIFIQLVSSVLTFAQSLEMKNEKEMTTCKRK